MSQVNSEFDPNVDAQFRHIDRSSALKDSASTDPEELQRLREWIDHQDWDVLDVPTELQRDVDICLRILTHGTTFAPLASGEGRVESQAQREDQVHETPANRITVAEEVDPSDNDLKFEPTPSGDRFRHRFENPRFLGAGGFGIVFAVFDRSLGIEVALKMLRPSKSSSQELRRRFFSEAQSVVILSHPGIVRIYDAGKLATLPYITMTYVAGGTLADRSRSGKTWLTVRQATWLIAQIADSVHSAHSRAILHRDLKPSNILLCPAPNDSTEEIGVMPILTDFGLAKNLESTTNSQFHTKIGGTLGTVRYMSPEQAYGATQDIGTTSDIFSLGIIYYELLVGQVPFDDPVDHEVRNQIVSADPIRPRLIQPQIPRDAEAIVLKCLAKEPSNRYQTARELMLDLQRLLRSEPVEAQRSTTLRRWYYASRKNPLITASIVLTLLANMIAIFGLTSAWRREWNAKEREHIARESEKEAQQKERQSLETALKIIDRFCSSLGDNIFANKPIKEVEFLEAIEEPVRFLEKYASENPKEDYIRHRLSVMKHFESMGHQRLGEMDLAVNDRIAVVAMLDDLVAKHPDNLKYRFQRFFSRRMLASFFVGQPLLQPHDFPFDAPSLLELAFQEIDELCELEPNNIDYFDNRASTIRTMAWSKPFGSSEQMKLLDRMILESQQNFERSPDRPDLMSYAIFGASSKAEIFQNQKDYARAIELNDTAVSWMRSMARHPNSNYERGLEYLSVWEQRVDLLMARDRLEEALDALEECDRIIEQMDVRYTVKTYPMRHRFRSQIHRVAILRKLDRHEEIPALEESIRNLVIVGIDDPLVLQCFRECLLGGLVPECIVPLIPLSDLP